jgi:DNA-binding transcriptional MerR regulator
VTSPDRIGIGSAARALGTTERALRYYEQRGLLPPAQPSPGGHRRYDEFALRRARRVLALRELGLSLDTIGRVITGAGQSDLAAALRAQAARLDVELDALGSLRDRISTLLAASPTALHTDNALGLLEELAMKIVLRRIYTRTGDDGTTAAVRARSPYASRLRPDRRQHSYLDDAGFLHAGFESPLGRRVVDAPKTTVSGAPLVHSGPSRRPRVAVQFPALRAATYLPVDNWWRQVFENNVTNRTKRCELLVGE